jgi:hypothetical protein
MSRTLALFESTHAVIKAERLCAERGLRCRTIAVPRAISSNCGIALEIATEALPDLASLLLENNLSFTRHPVPE